MSIGSVQGGSTTSVPGSFAIRRESADVLGAMKEAAGMGDQQTLMSLAPVATHAVQNSGTPPMIADTVVNDLANPTEQTIGADSEYFTLSANPYSPLNRASNASAASANQQYAQSQAPGAQPQFGQSQFGQAGGAGTGSAGTNGPQLGYGQQSQPSPLVQQSPNGLYGQGQ